MVDNINYKKGIILAGGKGSRLWPITKIINKHLIPIYNKPMIFYPLATLMLAGIREILIITTKNDQLIFKEFFGNGEKLGLKIKYKMQINPIGIVDGIRISENFINNENIALILGDNFFHGSELIPKLKNASKSKLSTIFIHPVNDPSRYGIATLDDKNKIINLEEKPQKPESNLAITGLYFFDNSLISKSKDIFPSQRGEYEIVDILKSYLSSDKLNHQLLGRGTIWLDTGTNHSLNLASNYVKTLEDRNGLYIGCLEEISLLNGWINKNEIKKIALEYEGSEYGNYLENLIIKTI